MSFDCPSDDFSTQAAYPALLRLGTPVSPHMELVMRELKAELSRSGSGWEVFFFFFLGGVGVNRLNHMLFDIVEFCFLEWINDYKSNTIYVEFKFKW